MINLLLAAEKKKPENCEDIQLAQRFAKLLPLVYSSSSRLFLGGIHVAWGFSQARRLDEHYEAPNSLRLGRWGSERSPCSDGIFGHSRGGQVMQFIP